VERLAKPKQIRSRSTVKQGQRKPVPQLDFSSVGHSNLLRTRSNAPQRPQANVPWKVAEPGAPSWGQYTRANARREDVQRIGTEVELKPTQIPYGDPGTAGGAFRQWAGRHGHKAVYRARDRTGEDKHTFHGVEIHLDQGVDAQSALLELVTHPMSPEKTAHQLARLRDEIEAARKTSTDGKDGFHAWLHDAFEPALDPDEHGDQYRYLKDNLRVVPELAKGGLFPSMGHVTTTHTAKEMKQLGRLPMFTRATHVAGDASTRLSTRRASLSARDLADAENPQEVVDKYLAAAPSAVERQSVLKPGTLVGKGTAPMIKHARQQFERTAGGTTGGIPHTVPVDRLTSDAGTLGPAVNSYTNKIQPVHERNGEIAYVVEYRGKGHVENAVGHLLKGGREEDFVRATREALYPPARRSTSLGRAGLNRLATPSVTPVTTAAQTPAQARLRSLVKRDVTPQKERPQATTTKAKLKPPVPKWPQFKLGPSSRQTPNTSLLDTSLLDTSALNRSTVKQEAAGKQRGRAAVKLPTVFGGDGFDAGLRIATEGERAPRKSSAASSLLGKVPLHPRKGSAQRKGL